jgi:hypothetical protein
MTSRRRDVDADQKKASGSGTSVSRKLVDLIERNAEELTNRWLADVRREASLTTYHGFDDRELYERAYQVFSHLGKWISRETTKDAVARDYMALGCRRREEGFALSEVIRALILIRRNLWRKVMEEGLLDTSYELYQAIELNDRVTLFFDRAILYTTLGYEKQS